MRISIPYWLRSPKYRASIRRRLQEPATIVSTGFNHHNSAQQLQRLERRGTHVFVEGHRLLRPRRRAWWLSPAFFAGVASVAVGVILALLQHAATP